MNIELIKEKCKKNKIIGREILFYPEVQSTNDIAKEKAEHGFLEGTVIIADYQTKGRGTRGAYWFSSPAEAVLVSVMMYPGESFLAQRSPRHQKTAPRDDNKGETVSCDDNSLSLRASETSVAISDAKIMFLQEICALAMCKTVKKFLPKKEVYIKHPNDVYVVDKKIAGVLVETSSMGNECEYAILGIGIDVNISEFPKELKDIATSMKLETGEEIKREDVVVELLRNLESCCAV